jgi:cysteinyl-tRNA synthetase
MLCITNSLTNKKERFSTLQQDKVLLYVCGITPYDHAHIGHARVYIFFDLVVRFLTFLGYQVRYCRNFTDIDDKLLKKAQDRFSDAMRYPEIADEVITSFTDQMRLLNCQKPDIEPRVTENIPQIIQFIEDLIAQGKAYVVDGDVYYDISSFPDYGKLSGQHLDQLHAGTRVAVDVHKRNPLDFALWKSEPEGVFWKSPWGYGRPGWHIECSALALTYLGSQIDIHGGGLDLKFPHHENEIAQTEGLTGKKFANYWIHNAFVQINKEKMSKSLGNFFSIATVLNEFDPMIVRYYLLSHQYRAPLDFSYAELESVGKAYQKLCKLFENVEYVLAPDEIKKSNTVQKMVTFLADDFNTSGMLGVLFDELKLLGRDQNEAAAVKAFIINVLGLTLQPIITKNISISPELQKLVEEREAARLAKNWKRADQIRDELKKFGVDVQDKKI